jgi:hypothetical protein
MPTKTVALVKIGKSDRKTIIQNITLNHTKSGKQ